MRHFARPFAAGTKISSIIAVGVAVALLGAAALWIGLVAGGGRNSTGDAVGSASLAPEISVPTVTTDEVAVSSLITGIADVPLYPGARKDDTKCRDDPSDNCLYSFEVSGTVDEVANFYIDTLTGRGWVHMKENLHQDRRYLEFFLPSSTETGSVRRYIVLNVYGSSSPQNRRFWADVRFERWPDSIHPPIFPGAKQSETHWNVTEASIDRVTAYTVDAAPAEVEAYYKEEMLRQGWRYADKEEYQGRLGMHFTYYRVTDVVRKWGSSVMIYTHLEADGQTGVEVWATGYETYELWLDEQKTK